MNVIDVDGHIVEPEEMFNLLSPEYYPRRPLAIHLPKDTIRGDFNGCWIVEGKTHPTMGGGRGRTSFFIPEDERSKKTGVRVGSQTLADVNARIEDLQQLDIDIQVIFPTIFLTCLTEDVRFEAALCQAYNDYLATACSQSNGRLHWVAPLPFRDPIAAVKELRRVKKLGAKGVFTMGMVWDKNLADPTFFPIYQEAAALDLPICVHLGWASPTVTELFTDGQAFFNSAVIPVIWAFMYMMGAGLLTRFPKLRIGFFETGGEWVPYAMNQLRRRVAPVSLLRGEDGVPSLPTGIDREHFRDPEEFFRGGRAFVNCEGDEDIQYLIKHLGEDCLMCSSDFPHGDPSAEENFASSWRNRSDVSESTKKKVLSENAARLFGFLSENER